jgi:UDP-glucose 4-epimerase
MQGASTVKTPSNRPRVLLVGSTGKVGQLLYRGWLNGSSSGIELICQTRRKIHDQNESFVEWDPLQPNSSITEWIVKNGALDAMIVLAGVVSGSDEELHLNSTIAVNCINAAKAALVPRVLVASSSAVYGVWKNGPYTETDETRPVSQYGQAKLEMEQVCANLIDASSNICMMRIGNVVGADALLTAKSSTLCIDQFDDGHGPRRSYIGPLSLLSVLESLICNESSLPYSINIGQPNPLGMEELAQSADRVWTYKRVIGRDNQNITLDVNLLKGFHSFPPLSSSPRSMVNEWVSLI